MFDESMPHLAGLRRPLGKLGIQSLSCHSCVSPMPAILRRKHGGTGLFGNRQLHAELCLKVSLHICLVRIFGKLQSSLEPWSCNSNVQRESEVNGIWRNV